MSKSVSTVFILKGHTAFDLTLECVVIVYIFDTKINIVSYYILALSP